MTARLNIPRVRDLAPKTRSAFPGAIVFAFDDAKGSTALAYSVLQPAGIPAILPVNPGNVGTSDNAPWSDIDTWVAGGWEVINHSNVHADLTLLSAPALATDIATSRDILVARGHAGAAKHFVVPFHTTNNAVRAAVQDAGYLTCRDQSSSIVQGLPRPLYTAFQLYSVLFNVSDMVGMKALLDDAVNTKALCMIHTHGGDTNFWGQMKDHIVNNGYLASCMTMTQAYDQMVFNGLMYDGTDY